MERDMEQGNQQGGQQSNVQRIEGPVSNSIIIGNIQNVKVTPPVQQKRVGLAGFLAEFIDVVVRSSHHKGERFTSGFDGSRWVWIWEVPAPAGIHAEVRIYADINERRNRLEVEVRGMAWHENAHGRYIAVAPTAHHVPLRDQRDKARAVATDFDAIWEETAENARSFEQIVAQEDREWEETAKRLREMKLM